MSDAPRVAPGGRFLSFADELGLLRSRVLAARSGSPTLEYNGTRLLSGHDPWKEARRKAGSVDGERVALVGLGLGYLASALGSRLATLIRAAGEAERLMNAHARNVPEYSAAFSDLAVGNWEELERATWDAVARGEILVLDPSWSANPELVARIREVEASARWGAAPWRRSEFRNEAGRTGGGSIADRAPGCDEDRIEAAARELSEETITVVVQSQGRHNFHEYPPFSFEVASPPRVDTPPKRILCVQPSSIGDVLYFTPALAALRKRYPGATIGLVVDDDAVSAVENGDADVLFVARRTAWCLDNADAIAGVKRFLALLAAWDPDLVINPHATARAAWYATVAATTGRTTHPAPILGTGIGPDGGPYIRGTCHHARWLTEMGSALTLGPIPSPLLPPPGVRPPWLVSAELARRCGVSVSSVVPRLEPGRKAMTAAAVFRASSSSSDRPYIAVHTGSRAAERRYRRAAWPEVIEGLLALDHDVVLIGGPADAERNEWIRGRIPPNLIDRVADATARGDLKFTAALLSGATMLVGPETSTVHLASAVGVRALTITGRVLSGWSGAVSAQSLVIHGPADPPWCRLLPPETVVAAAAFALGRAPRPVLPEGFEIAETGAHGAGEFWRAAAPWHDLPYPRARETLLGLAWAVFVGALNDTLGWPEATPDATQVRELRCALPPCLVADVVGLLELTPGDPWWRRFSAVPFGESEAIENAQHAARTFLKNVI